MPAKDTYHQENPETNQEIASSVPERPKETSSAGRTLGGLRIAPSAQILRLARRLRKDPDELARSIPPDTLRRTHYPVRETVNEDGTRTFKHDPQIAEVSHARRLD